MPTIYGVVQGNVVMLPEDAELPDGATVEVRTVLLENQRLDTSEAEEQFKRALVERGILARVRTPLPIPPEADRSPIQVTGNPLSEMIVEERR